MIGFALALELAGYNQPKRTHPLNKRWVHMLGRCYNPTSKSFKDYGARGITVCQRWRDSFWSYVADIGPCPGPGYELNRIDNNGPYAPDNCNWIEKKYQARNKRNSVWIEFRGERLPLVEWARRIGVKYDTLKARLLRGYPLEEIMTNKVMPGYRSGLSKGWIASVAARRARKVVA